MDIGRSQFIVLRSPHPFLAALLSCKTSPVQIYLSLESIGSRTPDTAGSPLCVRPLDRKIVQKFVRNVREDSVNDFLLRCTTVFVVCQ